MKARVLTKDSEKQALIKCLSDRNVSLMFFYEEELGEGTPHEKAGKFITLVRPPYNYGQFEKWLYLGNWQAIFPANKKYQPFNTFKTKGPEIEKRMNEAKVTLIIDSFHDDIEWNVIEKT
ncbi:hypothetical protein HC024_13585 [Methylococcaceae bacterium WWC4]|nr:hypothetical protein [Methylococcaceae bacterium WWC4]